MANFRRNNYVASVCQFPQPNLSLPWSRRMLPLILLNPLSRPNNGAVRFHFLLNPGGMMSIYFKNNLFRNKSSSSTWFLWKTNEPLVGLRSELFQLINVNSYHSSWNRSRLNEWALKSAKPPWSVSLELYILKHLLVLTTVVSFVLNKTCHGCTGARGTHLDQSDYLIGCDVEMGFTVVRLS